MREQRRERGEGYPAGGGAVVPGRTAGGGAPVVSDRSLFLFSFSFFRLVVYMLQLHVNLWMRWVAVMKFSLINSDTRYVLEQIIDQSCKECSKLQQMLG
ncbi:hypothetical protein R6Q59_002473 [Mikania micrantha]